MSDRKKLGQYELDIIKNMVKDGDQSAQYMIEILHRTGFEVPPELHDAYKSEPVDESFNQFLNKANISPDEDLAVYFKQKWDQEYNKKYIKQYGLGENIENIHTTGKHVSDPDTLHLPEGDIDAFYKGTEFDDSLDWEKHYKNITEERNSSKSLLQRAKDWFNR